MPGLRQNPGSWHRALHMWQMPAACRNESTHEQGKTRRAVNSGLRHQKKNPTHGARHGPFARQIMYFNAHDMLRKVSKSQNGYCKMILVKMARRWQIPQVIWWNLGKLVQTENTRVWETQDRIGSVQYGDSSEESWTWSSQIEDNGKKEVSSRICEWRILRPEMEIMKQATWSRIRRQNTVNKEVQEIVGNGKLTGSVRKETIAVFDTIWISVQNRHSRIFLQVLSSPRGKSPSGRILWKVAWRKVL